jgi:outer membrane protein TolC
MKPLAASGPLGAAALLLLAFHLDASAQVSTAAGGGRDPAAEGGRGPAPTAGGEDVLHIDLASVLRLADQRNLDIAIYVQRVAEASAQLAGAKVLAVPTLRIGGSYGRHGGTLQETSGQVVDADRTARFTGLGAGAVGAGDLRSPGVALEVDLADAIFRPLVARQNQAAMQAASTANRDEVLVDVASAYLRLLEARDEARVAQESLGRATDLASLTASYAAAGEGLQADAEMAAVQPLLWQQRQADAAARVEAATAALARLLHLEPAVRLEPMDASVPLLEIFGADEKLDDLIARALEARPETDVLEAQIAAAEGEVKAQKYRYYVPSVALGYSAGDFGGGPASASESSGHRDDLTLQLYWQLDNFGFGNRARVNERQSQLSRIELERDKLHDRIIAEVREDFARISSLREQVRLTEAAVRRAEQAYSLQRTRIFDRQGLPIEALQAMQTLATADLAHLAAVADFSIAQIRLHTALGNPLDSRY